MEICYFSLDLCASLIVNPLGKKWLAGCHSTLSLLLGAQEALLECWARREGTVHGVSQQDLTLNISYFVSLMILSADYVNLIQCVHPVPFSIYSVLLFSSLSIVIYPLRVICHQVSGKKV